MKGASVSNIKGSYSRPGCTVPRAGTNLRAIYDLFFANRGRPVQFNTTEKKNQQAIYVLRDFYLLDIRRLSKCKWVLAGEWFGRVYVDYIAEHLESSPCSITPTAAAAERPDVAEAQSTSGSLLIAEGTR